MAARHRAPTPLQITTEYLNRCIQTLEGALDRLSNHQAGETAYEIYRTACVKQFELILEQCGKLLRRRVSDWSASNRAAASLTFKDVFRTAAQHGLIEAEVCERWLRYRDIRNDTAHDYGEGFAEAALGQLPQFALDAKALSRAFEAGGNG